MISFIRVFTVVIAAVATLAALPASAQWTEIPGTSLDQAKASNGSKLVPDLPHGGESMGTAAMIGAWNSAALDTDAGRLLFVRHGGHADSAHNGVVAFDLSTNRWSLLRAPSMAYVPIPSPAGTVYGPTYLDGSPASVHTYDCEAYIPGIKRVYSGGGIFWSPPGLYVPQKVWWWQMGNKEYERGKMRRMSYGCDSVL